MCVDLDRNIKIFFLITNYLYYKRFYPVDTARARADIATTHRGAVGGGREFTTIPLMRPVTRLLTKKERNARLKCN